MVFRFLHSCCKLLQRQTFTCLSSKSGIWFCIGGLILLAISTLQFSEALIEWSMQKYTYTFSIDHDNIGGKSYQHRLCLPGPVDVVYTWVNGSDPLLIKELVEVKLNLAADLNKTSQMSGKEDITYKKFGMKGKNLNKFRWVDGKSCPYPYCASFNAISFSLPQNISKESCFLGNPFFKNFPVFIFNNKIDPSVKIIKFDKKDNYDKGLNKTINVNGKDYKFEKVFITSTVINGAKKLHGVGIINDTPGHVSRKMINNALEAVKIFNTRIELAQNISILSFSDADRAKRFLGPLKNQIIVEGQKFKIMPATLVWKPMTELELGHEMLNEDISSSRFADNDELKYSLRSVEKYAPWIRNVYIVTNGQIPSWLNLDHPRIKVLTHKELFLNKSHLPTYSSPSIETHIHRIPGLSTKFIYMNDDVFFGDYVWPDDFYTHSKGQKVYLTWPVPNCNEGCPAAWVNDRYCDKPCNVSECDWDGGDCLNIKGKPGWQFGTQSMTGRHYSAIGEYCNGGCANSWIGDRYCDANCNVKACGYDAGDCGLDKFDLLYSMTANTSVALVALPRGTKAFYINLTTWINNGDLTEGEYTEVDVVRTAVFSKKFKIMTVSLYANFSDTISFKFKGFQGSNKTVTLNINITVDTRESTSAGVTNFSVEKIASKQQTVPSVSSLKPFSLYSIAKRMAPLQGRQNKGKPRKASNSTIRMIKELYEKNQTNLPSEMLKKLNEAEVDLKTGDITQHGFNENFFEILHAHVTGNTNGTKINKISTEAISFRVGRRLASVDEQLNFGTKANINRILARLGAKYPRLHSKHVNTRETSKHQFRRLFSNQGWNSVGHSFLSSPLRWERQQFFMDITSANERLKREQNYLAKMKPNRKLLDTFASSLLHVSRVYNRAFSYKARKVPAHIPHMVDIDVINEMQEKFWPHFEQTSSHKIRSPDDMQFAFSYFYYLMGVPASLNISQLFFDLDTDKSGILSDRELRTLATRLFTLPLEPKDLRALEEMLQNCSDSLNNSTHQSKHKTGMPVVTIQLLTNCKPISNLLGGETKKKSQYKYEEVGDEDVTFKMIRNNVSQLVFQLDWIRKNKRKFVCLNDNIDHENPQTKIIRTVLKDFYESMFPLQSQFELPKTLRNKFLNIDELNSWMKKAKQQQNSNTGLFYLLCVAIVLILFRKKLYRLYRTIIYYVATYHKEPSYSQSSNVEIVSI